MPNWLVRLAGERFDLEDLPSLLRSPKCSVIEEGGLYYLKSSDFDSLGSADQVRERAIEVVKILNAAMKLRDSGFRDVSTDAVTLIDDGGRRHHYVYLTASVSARSKVRANLTVIKPNGTPQAGSPSSDVESWIDLAEADKAVAEALQFLKEGTWVSLYKVYEIIGEDVGDPRGMAQNGWATKQEFSRFTQTAQSKAALGEAARHAAAKFRPPAQPMTLEEARYLLRKVVVGWLKSRA